MQAIRYYPPHELRPVVLFFLLDFFFFLSWAENSSAFPLKPAEACAPL
jgi:hypothetical protein